MCFWQSCSSLGQSRVIGHRMGRIHAIPQLVYCRRWKGLMVTFPVAPHLWPFENRLAKFVSWAQIQFTNLTMNQCKAVSNFMAQQSMLQQWDDVSPSIWSPWQPFCLIPMTAYAVDQEYFSRNLGWWKVKLCWLTSAHLLVPLPWEGRGHQCSNHDQSHCSLPTLGERWELCWR